MFDSILLANLSVTYFKMNTMLMISDTVNTFDINLTEFKYLLRHSKRSSFHVSLQNIDFEYKTSQSCCYKVDVERDFFSVGMSLTPSTRSVFKSLAIRPRIFVNTLLFAD